LRVLVDHLPPESATKTAAREELTPEDLAAMPAPSGYGPWSNVELRLADVHDALQWVIYAVYHSQGGKPKKPDPYPRPGVASKRQGRKVSAEGLAYLQRLRENRGAA
jgi:hypothetical protein